MSLTDIRSQPIGQELSVSLSGPTWILTLVGILSFLSFLASLGWTVTFLIGSVVALIKRESAGRRWMKMGIGLVWVFATIVFWVGTEVLYRLLFPPVLVN